MIEQEVFEKAADKWKNFKQLPWNRMRYEITNKLLLEEIDRKELSILNIGCGDGVETMLLDDLNASHTLVDYSHNMLEEADDFLKLNDFKSAYQCKQSDIKEIKSKLNIKFDLILFHNVIEYIEKPQQTILDLKGLLKDHGILSLRHLNRYTNICAPAAFENNLDKVMEYLNSPFMNSSFGVPIHTYTGEEITGFLEEAGFNDIKRYGLMSLNAFISNNEIKYDESFYKKQLEIEVSLLQKFPYYHMARFGLFLCKIH